MLSTTLTRSFVLCFAFLSMSSFANETFQFRIKAELTNNIINCGQLESFNNTKHRLKQIGKTPVNWDGMLNTGCLYRITGGHGPIFCALAEGGSDCYIQRSNSDWLFSADVSPDKDFPFAYCSVSCMEL